MLISIAAVTRLLVLIPAMGQDVPPSPTIGKPQDYNAWYNAFVSRGKNDNSLAYYETLAPNGNQMLDWRTNQWSKLPANKIVSSSTNPKTGIQFPGERVREQMQRVLGTRWISKDQPELAQYLDDCKPALEMLKKAATKKYFWHPIAPQIECLDFIAMPYLNATKVLAQAALAQATRDDADPADAIIDAACNVLRMSDHMHQGPLVINALVACNERDQANRFILAALAQGTLTAAHAERAARSLYEAETPAMGLSQALVIEWLLALDILQWICPSGQVQSDHWNWYVQHMKEMNPKEFSDKSAPDTFDPGAAVPIIRSRFEALLDITKRPLYSRRLKDLNQLDEQQRPVYQRHPFCHRTWASMQSAYEITLRTEALRRATLLTLAIHSHYRAHGRWPATLDGLAIPDLKHLRVDPYGGQDFVYKIANGHPVLYCVGTNEKDDGGRHDPKWGETGKDYVFWPPHP